VAELGVSIAVEHLLRDGFMVAIPIVDDGCDLLAYDERRCWRLQVKATGAAGGEQYAIRIRRGRRRRNEYGPSVVDAFIGVHIDRRQVVCIPVRDAAHTTYFAFSRASGGVSALRNIRHRRIGGRLK
jgi:hypothetical protein